MSRAYVFDHPLIQHKPSYVGDARTGTKEFKKLIDEVGMLMAYEVTRDLELQDVRIQTPVIEMTAKRLAGEKLAIVPTLRAGLGMTDGVLSPVPAAGVGHIGLCRGPETLETARHFAKVPQDIDEHQIIVVDPMLATGASAIEAISSLKKCGAKSAHFMCLIATPEGVEKMQEVHPGVDIYIATLDERLNDEAYTTPGLSDVEDRLSGTK